MQVWQILAAEDGQRLTSIQRPRPKRQFTHVFFFYIKRCSINLFDLLGITAGLLRVLMDESGDGQPVNGEQAHGSVAARTEPGQARVSVALRRSLFSVGSAVPPRFNTPWPTWRTLQTHAALRSLRAAQPPRSREQPFPRSFARVRVRDTLRVAGEEGGSE